MASSPQWKVYDAAGIYQAACKEIGAAAVLVSFYGDGAVIKHGHGSVVWHEGYENQPASESYDHVAETAYARVKANTEAVIAKRKAEAIALEVKGRGTCEECGKKVGWREDHYTKSPGHVLHVRCAESTGLLR